MTAVVEIDEVTVRRGRSVLLDRVTWTADEVERWVVIGPNGAGKTTLMSILSGHLFPSAGKVGLLGERLGAVDVFDLRPRIGLASSDNETRIPGNEKVGDVVMSSAYGVFGRWHEQYDLLDEARRLEVMSQLGIDHLVKRTFGTLSQGEKQRVQIARALMTDPELLLLDEPTSGLDLAARELLLGLLSDLFADDTAPAAVLVTHRPEEIPPGITHALFLKQGRVVVAGPLADVMNADVLSETFDLDLVVHEQDGRYFARAAVG
ncbi:MAG: ATP-binding cassette domain-containing protein [Propionibacteriaceae bacterium]|jgi:iron complex transport system ATP-binding protein|nr:ATP-binding cassette domain-containing protein [Propionibacteriaceae bacterium]